ANAISFENFPPASFLPTLIAGWPTWIIRALIPTEFSRARLMSATATLMGRPWFIFQFQNLRRNTEPGGGLRAVVKCTRIDRRSLHQDFVELGDTKSDPIFAKQGRLHRANPGVLLCPLPRKFKNMLGANCHLRQSTEINESVERS